MNVEDLKKAVVNWNESRDRGDESIENPFVVYFEDERGETNGEKISYIEHMHAQVTLELESEAKALAEQKRQLKAELDKVNAEYNKCVEENNQMDSILKKIYELKRLHAISQNEAQNIFPQSAPELRHLSHLQIQDDELQNNIDNLNKEMTEALNKLEDSKERLSETVAEYEEKKNQEEHKLELLVVIQNVVKKKREQILERNATIVELKNESIEIENQLAPLDLKISTTTLEVSTLKAQIQGPRTKLAHLEIQKAELNKEMAAIDKDIENREREDEEINRAKHETIGKLRKRIGVFKEKKAMYEEKAKARLRLQGLVKELEELGVELEVEPKMRALLK